MPPHLVQLLVAQGHVFLMLPEQVAGGDELAHASWLGVAQATDANDCLVALQGVAWDWVVVDHYALDWRWESALRPVAGRLLVLDDLADRRHDCDLLLDQNFYCDMSSRYAGKVPNECQLLLGPRFALLRDEFLQLRQHCVARGKTVQRVLVFFGGVDAQNYTQKALAALASVRRAALQVDVVVGAQHPQRASIEALCLQEGYRCHVQTTRMAELMAKADLAIGAGGTATWERCCLGLPTLAASTAANQERQLLDAAAAGLIYAPDVTADVQEVFARHLEALLENGALRHLISSTGMATVDGRGALRVAARMGCVGVVLRQAGPEDSVNLYQWRNHPSIRVVSNNSAVIAWEDHCRWFDAVLRDAQRKLLIGMQEDLPIGVVRFDIQEDQAEVSIYMIPDAHASGRGGELLASAEQWLAMHCPGVRTLHAQVLGGNIRSNRLFMAAGYDVDNILFSKKLHAL